MEHRLELAYLGVEVPEPAALASTFTDVVGLVPGATASVGSQSAGTLTWRNDDRRHRLIVQAGDANDAVFVGIEAADDAAFDQAVTRLQSAGFDTTIDPGDDTICVQRCVDRLARVSAPWGTDIELVTGLAAAPAAFDSSLVPDGFLTEDVGFGHVVFITSEFEESRRFLVDALGFTQSDWLEMELAEGIELEVRFFHCNARHHTIAIGRAPFDLPQRLHHVMFEMRSRDDVGAAFDRLWNSPLGIPNGLGRHDNDGMFSFYLATPAGFQVEVGHGARTITDDWDDDRRYDRISAWGHQPLRQS